MDGVGSPRCAKHGSGLVNELRVEIDVRAPDLRLARHAYKHTPLYGRAIHITEGRTCSQRPPATTGSPTPNWDSATSETLRSGKQQGDRISYTYDFGGRLTTSVGHAATRLGLTCLVRRHLPRRGCPRLRPRARDHDRGGRSRAHDRRHQRTKRTHPYRPNANAGRASTNVTIPARLRQQSFGLFPN